IEPILNEARALKVIGAGEDGWKGTPEQVDANREAVRSLTPTGVEGATEHIAEPAMSYRMAEPETTPEPPDIHQVARSIAPDTFTEDDALSERRNTLRGWLDEARQPQVEAAQARGDTILAPDERLRDLAPDVSAAYRRAQAQMPAAAETETAPETAPEAQPIDEASA